MYSGELGYLVEGQEGVNFESVLTSISGKSSREKWANDYLTSLASLGIMSDSSDAKVNEYPLTANYVEDNNGVKTYYKEEYPWEYDDPSLQDKDKKGYKPLSVKDSVKAEVESVNLDKNGSWLAPPSSFSISDKGSYRQDISELKKATDILNKDLSKYLFYKADEDNLHVYTSTELSQLDPTS
jgi:hypothetical protein